MDKITSAQDDQLLNYLDRNLAGAQLIQFEKELESSAILKNRLEELRLIHGMLISSHSILESPSPLFVNKVMKNLHSKSYSSSLSPRNGLFLLTGVMIAAGILIAMVGAGIFDQMITLDQLLPVKNYFQQSLPVVSINGNLVIKVIVGLNLVLVFIVLDRTVLKPFFQRRAGMQL